MNSKNMMEQTAVKLEKIANSMVKKWTAECVEWSNFTELALTLSKKMDGVVISPRTVIKYEGYLIDLIKKKISNKKEFLDLDFLSGIEKVKEMPIEKEIIVDNTITYPGEIFITFGDKKIRYVLEPVIEPVKPEPQPEPKPQKKWTGLFDYGDNDDKLVIRYGKYRGCNLKEKSSVSGRFTDNYDLYGYICDCLKPEAIKKYESRRSEDELEKNIDTLLHLKSKIEKLKNINTRRLAIIRKIKGL